jgi:hypothetical protein
MDWERGKRPFPLPILRVSVVGQNGRVPYIPGTSSTLPPVIWLS